MPCYIFNKLCHSRGRREKNKENNNLCEKNSEMFINNQVKIENFFGNLQLHFYQHAIT